MNKFKLIAILLTSSFFLTCCDGDEDSGPDISSLKLTLSKSRIVADSLDFAKISVTNQADKNVMEFVTIYYNGEKLSTDRIISSKPSMFVVYAMFGNVKSNEAELEVVEDKNLKFVKNVLMEQYTGTWCGWCPRAIDQISNLQKTDKNVIHAAYHLSDEMTHYLNSTLFQSFGFTGIPTVHADRKVIWQGDISETDKLHSPSRIGISMEVTGDAFSISASVTVKFGYDFIEALRLSVFLIHDSLIANQANYYNTDPASPFYQAGSTMVNFVHRNVIQKPGTDIFGDVIPSSYVDIGSLYSRKTDFSDFTCNDIEKMLVIAFVTYGSGPFGGQVLNAVEARIGQKLELMYRDN